MVVRVKVSLEIEGKTVEVSAIALSTSESKEPQIIIPVELAKALGIWPSDSVSEGRFIKVDGEARVWKYPSTCRVRVVADDIETPAIDAELLISEDVSEVILNDKLVSELGIALEDVSRGLWRFRWESTDKIRRSVEPQVWR